MKLSLKTKVGELGKTEKRLSNKLKKLGIETLGDLIFYYPFRYDDYSRIVKISELKPNETVSIRGRIELIASKRTRSKRLSITECLVNDETGSIKVVWFNQSWLSKSFLPGDEVLISGKTSEDMFGVSFNSPLIEKANRSSSVFGSIQPVYPLTAGLSSRQLSLIIKSGLGRIEIEESLPEPLVKKYGLLFLPQAVKNIHFPKNEAELSQAKKRLSFDELFYIQLWSQSLKRKNASTPASIVDFNEEKTKALVNSLPFELTLDQKKTAWEIIKDMKKPYPMNRLLEGDVGSGKTLVAFIAAYNAALGKGQTVFMAPTEILASQHYQGALKLFKDRGIDMALITRTQKSYNGEEKTEKEMLDLVAKGEVGMIFGTHSLIQDKIIFKNLVLVVVDEQHRFGVEQRKKLKEKAGEKNPHFLSMTATPIPRTLALAFYGDLSLSIIKQMPKGRKKIITKVVSEEKRELAYKFMREQVNLGRQVFVVCPLIDQSDKLGAKSTKEEFERLDAHVFPEIKMGMLHGKLKPEAKEAVLKDFYEGRVKILVSTSVIEVGIDVPNANIMMIEGAERFGLSQLHQFRGRVGRGEHQSYCFLFSSTEDERVLSRLNHLVTCSDGFELANADLQLRGAGDVFGREQSGYNSLRLADINDLEGIKKAGEAANDFLDNYRLEDYKLVKNKLEEFDFVDHLE